MVLPLGVSALVAAALLADILPARVVELWARIQAHRRVVPTIDMDPGRERRAEQTARELLRSCVGKEEWAMYRELGFIRVWGSTLNSRRAGTEHAYLIYAHKPLVAYEPQTGHLLGEYCVEFPDDTRPYGSSRLPDSDDVLAKWMALTGDERRLIANSNMHMPGRQVDVAHVRRDLWRLSRWEQKRLRDAALMLGVKAEPRQSQS
jgi:hypothetical protein